MPSPIPSVFGGSPRPLSAMSSDGGVPPMGAYRSRNGLDSDRLISDHAASLTRQPRRCLSFSTRCGGLHAQSAVR